MTRVCLICSRTSDKPQYVEEISNNVTDDDKLNSGTGGDWGEVRITSPRNVAVNFQQDAEQVLIVIFFHGKLLNIL